jgi:hypothetical protein
MVQFTVGSDASIIDKRKEHSLRHSEDALVYPFDLSRKLWRTRGQTEKLKTALGSILEYVELKKPKTLAEAEHMLAAVSVIASETLLEVAADENETKNEATERASVDPALRFGP